MIVQLKEEHDHPMAIVLKKSLAHAINDSQISVGLGNCFGDM